MKILHKYILKEHLGPLIFALTTLTSLLLLNYIAKKFGDLVGKGLPWTAIAEFFGLSIPFTMALTFPMAVLVATLYAFGRLGSENEITALKANGVSLRAILTPVLVAAGFVTLFMVIFNDQVMSRANHQLAVLQMDIAQKKPTFALREQVINDVQTGRLYLRTNHIDEASNRMREVTIYDMSDPTVRRTIYADSGDLAMSHNQKDLLMTLYSGSMEDVPVQDPAQLQRLYFNSDLIVVKGVANQFQQSGTDTDKGQREMTVCEMQQRADSAKAEYLSMRQNFIQNLAMARATQTKVSPEVLQADTSLPSNVSLGGAYCALLRKLGIEKPNADSSKQDAPVFSGVAALQSQERMALQAQQKALQAQERMRQAQESVLRAQVLVKDSAAVKAAATLKAESAAKHMAALRMAAESIAKGLAPQIQQTQAPVPAVQLPQSKTATPTPQQPQPQPQPQPPASATKLQPPKPPAIPPSSPPPHPGQITPNMPLPFNPLPTGMLEANQNQMALKQLTIANYEVEIHKKFALAVACFVFVLLGAPIALRFPRGGVGLTIGVSLFVFALYYIGLIAGSSLATSGHIPPWIAMWGANIIFTLVALYLLRYMGKEGSTARGGDVRDMADTVKQWGVRRLRGLGITVGEQETT